MRDSARASASASAPASAPASALVALVGGFVLWGSAFLSLYALFSLGCANGWTTPRLAGLPLWHGVLLAVWAVHLALHAGLIAWLPRRAAGRPGMRHFLRLGTLGVAVASMGATLWTGLPIVLLSSCG